MDAISQFSYGSELARPLSGPADKSVLLAEIPASNLKLFSRILLMLHKIGDLLTIETSAERLVLRALSRAESAYVQVGLNQSFFTQYQSIPQEQSAPLSLSPSFDTSDEGERRQREGWSSRAPSPTSSTVASTTSSLTLPPRYLTVQVNSKQILLPFKGALSQCRRVTLRLCPSDSEGFGEVEAARGGSERKRRRTEKSVEELCLMITLHLEEAGVTKTFLLPFLEQRNILQPNFSRQACPTLIGTKAKLFLSWLQNFPEVDELSITCSAHTVKFRSFLDWAAINDAQSLDAQVNAALTGGSAVSAKSKAKALRLRSLVQTESTVSRDDFSVYDVAEACRDASMVFTLPEVRMFAAVAELSDEEMFVFGVEPGQPVLISTARKAWQSAAQQRAMRRRREGAGEMIRQSGEGGEEAEFNSSTVPPTPTSVVDSQLSYETSAALEQSQRQWSADLILATLAPEAAMQSSQVSQERGAGQERFGGSPSPSPAPEMRGRESYRSKPTNSPMMEL